MTIIGHLITSHQVVQELGISHTNLLQILHRRPELRPQVQLGKRGDMLWTPEEVAKLAEVHQARRRRKQRV